jgi:hypothetical protein
VTGQPEAPSSTSSRSAATDFFRGFDTQELIEEQGLFRDPRFLMDTDFSTSAADSTPAPG